MRWKVHELLYELRQDRKRKILFVEGRRDLAFWKGLVPLDQRRNTVIYPISQIDSPNTKGGERGRMVRVATEVSSPVWQERIRFFADADMDRVLQLSKPDNVVLTDGHDLDSYALSIECLKQICISGLALEDESTELLTFAGRICRPIGILRFTSWRQNLRLSFQRTVTEKNMRKFIINGSTGYQLDLERLCEALLQNSAISLSQKPQLMLYYRQEITTLSRHADAEIIHGKDLIHSLAWYFDKTSEHIESLVFLGIWGNLENIRQLSNLKAAEEWVRAV